MKLLKLLTIGFVSGLIAFGLGVVFGAPAWITWAIAMDKLKPTAANSLMTAIITNTAWYFLSLAIWPQPSFAMIYIMFAVGPVFASSLLVELLSEKLEPKKQPKENS